MAWARTSAGVVPAAVSLLDLGAFQAVFWLASRRWWEICRLAMFEPSIISSR